MLLKVIQNIRPRPTRSYSRFAKHLNPLQDGPHKRLSETVTNIETEIKLVLPRSKEEKTQKCIENHQRTSVPTPRPSHMPKAITGVPLFSKIQELDGNLNSILASIKSRKQREKSNRVLLEGNRLIRDAVESGAIPDVILFSRVDDLKNLSLPDDGVQLYKIPYKTISMWSDTSTCPGIMAILKTPPVHLKKPSKDSLPVTVICDNVRDPGNLGAVLRTVAGVGCKQILVTKGCVDLWEPKVLRSAAGAHFHLPIHKNVSLNMLGNFIQANSTVYLADNSELLTNDDMYPTGHGPFGRLVPIFPYSSVDFTQAESAVLIIGGETQGLSNDAMQLACDRQGARLHIPLANGIESLNTASALSVILFEMKRQMSIKMETCE